MLSAGYLHGGVKTRETFRIEPATEELIGSNYGASPAKRRNGDFHFSGFSKNRLPIPRLDGQEYRYESKRIRN